MQLQRAPSAGLLAPPPGRGATAVFVAGWALLILACGLAAALDSLKAALVALALVLMPAVLMAPAVLLIVPTLALGFLVVGNAEYFLHLSQLNWAPSALFGAMLLRALFQSRSSQSASALLQPLPLALLFLAVLIPLSALCNWSPALQSLAGARHYLLPLGMVAMVALSADQPFWVPVFRAIALVLILQLPLALIQHLYYVEPVLGVDGNVRVTWDAVVGSFGGDPLQGGASGSLALFLAFGVVAVAALRREALISARLAWLAWLCALATMALAEIKVVIVLLPLAVVLYQRRRLLRSLPAFIGWVLGTCAFVVALLLVYNALFWQNAGQGVDNPAQVLDLLFREEGHVEAYNSLTGEISRAGALVLWWEQNIDQGQVWQALLGHGPAASKISATFGYGEAARRFPVNLNATTLSALLWDLGLAGAISFIAILLGSAWTAFAALRRMSGLDAHRRMMLELCGIGALLCLATLPYNLACIETPAIQMLLAVFVGHALAAGAGHGAGPVQVRDWSAGDDHER